MLSSPPLAPGPWLCRSTFPSLAVAPSPWALLRSAPLASHPPLPVPPEEPPASFLPPSRVLSRNPPLPHLPLWINVLGFTRTVVALIPGQITIGSENNIQGCWSRIFTCEGEEFGMDVLFRTPSFAWSASQCMASASTQGS